MTNAASQQTVEAIFRQIGEGVAECLTAVTYECTRLVLFLIPSLLVCTQFTSTIDAFDRIWEESALSNYPGTPFSKIKALLIQLILMFFNLFLHSPFLNIQNTHV